LIDSTLLVVTAVALTLAGLSQRREFFRLRWQPNRHTAAALAVGLLAAAFSTLALAVPRDSFAYGFILCVLIFGVCGFALPWAYVLFVEVGSPAALGIRRERWAPSLLVSVLFAAGSVFGMLERVDLSRFENSQLVAAAFSLNVGGLFELFLYCGFIHLRLRDAFGPLPAIFGAAAIYSLWHIGTELPMHADPAGALIMLFVVGVLCQSIFAITYNALAIWPLFFTAGVMNDFIVNLDLPESITTSLGWALVGWALAIAVPFFLWRHSQKRSAGRVLG
jgi:membrane protease YdiL (CAAX protease family)